MNWHSYNREIFAVSKISSLGMKKLANFLSLLNTSNIVTVGLYNVNVITPGGYDRTLSIKP